MVTGFKITDNCAEFERQAQEESYILDVPLTVTGPRIDGRSRFDHDRSGCCWDT
jgi:hypothetical protein